LPGTGNGAAGLDETEVVKMLRGAIDSGVNYLDLPYVYDEQRREGIARCVGRALQDGYREKIKIAAGLPAPLIKSGRDVERFLDKQLKLLRTDRLDFFLIAALDRQTWPALPAADIFRRVEAAISAGRLSHLGFAFHDDFQTLRTIMDACDKWALAQFQYSFMDIDHHPGTGGIKYAGAKGLAVVITSPLKGGRLTRKIPETAAVIWGGNDLKRTPVEWSLRWAWNLPEVSTVVVDMSTIGQVKENVALAERVEPDSLTVPEELLVNRVRDAYLVLKPIPCTACRGCMPCPNDIDVPRIFELFNDAIMYRDNEIPRSIYRDEEHRIQDCDECGGCEKACGRHIAIIDQLKQARRLLAEDN
jgi:predicted aldo/keto reductase-like oxidoreductase